MSALCVPRAICFDLDGTLVDSVADLANSANWTRRHFGLGELPARRIAGFVGDGARRLLERTLSELGTGVDLDEALDRFRVHYLEHCLDRTRCYPGVLETLDALGHLPLAIVTNKPQAMADKIADGLGLRSRLQAVVGARRGVPVKPEPDLVLEALRQLNTGAPGTWMVGDGRNDILVARRLNLVSVGVSYGLTPAEELRRLDPDHMIDQFEELLRLF